MADILGAQMSFISKRILVDEQDAAVEMPPIGEPGACLMASAMHYNDGRGTSNTMKAFKYHAYGCPCGYMRHDKVFLVPEGLNAFVPDNPNELPFPCDSYIGIPLFAEGKCFAHFAVMWSLEGSKRRKLSWAHIELFLHSIEDIILQRLLEGSNFGGNEEARVDRSRIIPHDAVTVAQSLRPYARSLSHELRTPMQGVVGMLDVMYATVLEAAEGQSDPKIREIFQNLRENIEIVQDSSRRAVEAADNVVHAYDMDMHVPDAPHSFLASDTLHSLNGGRHQHGRPEILVAGSDLPIARPNKRRRGEEGSSSSTSPSKLAATRSSWAARAEPSEDLKRGFHEAEDIPEAVTPSMTAESLGISRMPSPPKSLERSIAPGLRHTQLRNVLQYVVNEGLKIGGRPESAIARETDTGEIIEVMARNPNGEERKKQIEWSVDSAIPETIFVDERDLGKLISCVFLNAIKFTEQGKITVTARLSSQLRHIVVKVTDSGPGIPAAFLPKLFKPFSQEDGSLTRQSEGLGLGLLVAKGIARKLGGDLMCTRAETTGPNHGSEFEMRVLISGSDGISRPPSPMASPSLRSRTAQSLDEVRRRTITPTPVAGPDSETALKMMTPTNGAARRPSLDMRSITMPPPRSIPQFQLPLAPSSPVSRESSKRPSMLPRKSSATINGIDKALASKYPLSFLVAEDNKINRKLLVSMLSKFGYKTIHEAYDGAEAVRQMEKHRDVDVILMDLWMPFMDGYEATEKILNMPATDGKPVPTILAVTADVTDTALERAAKVGMKGFMTKPFKLHDLQRLILEYCAQQDEATPPTNGFDTATPEAHSGSEMGARAVACL